MSPKPRTSQPGAALPICLLIILAMLSGCSDKRAVPTLPGAHPDSWMDKSSPDFHGQVVQSSGSAGCAVCHGQDWLGGKVGVSCADCHQGHTGVCILCHGGVDNNTGAPPLGLRGETADTTIAVGAHTAHLSGSEDSISVGIACGSCHYVPVFVADPRHIDRSGGVGHQPVDSVAEITWQGIADGGGAAWNRSTRSCTGTYCHGNFDGGNRSNAPVWTASSQAHCGSCHDIGITPAELQWKHAFHVGTAGLACADCHAGVVDTLLTIVGRALHINGEVNFQVRDTARCSPCHSPNPAACVLCHGGIDNQTGAPPRGLHGETAASQLAVGAHTGHLESGYISDGVPCAECHLVPATVASPGHFDADSIAEITWGTLAGSASQWNRGTATCRQTYCHGNFSGGYAGNAPIWTAPGQAACGSCHDDGTNPNDLGGRHEKHVTEEHFGCDQCHAATVDLQLNIIGKSRHIDGRRDVVFLNGQGSYANGTCSNLGEGCHGSESWY